MKKYISIFLLLLSIGVKAQRSETTPVRFDVPVTLTVAPTTANALLRLTDTTGTLATKANSATLAQLQTRFNLKQNLFSGTGFVKASGSTVTYDNSTYLTTYTPIFGTANTWTGYQTFTQPITIGNNIFMGGAANDNPAIGSTIQINNTGSASTTTGGYAIQLAASSDLLFNSFNGAPGSISFIPRFRMTNAGLLNYSADMGSSYGDRTVVDRGNVYKFIHSETGYTVTLTGSGNGSNTTITIPHGLTGIDTDSFVLLTPNSNAASNYKYATVDATNVYIYYAVAPTSGSQNLSYSALIKYVQR